MLTITQGDTASLNLTAKSGDGVAFDLSAATLTTYIRSPNGTSTTIANGSHTINADQVTNPGKFILTLSAADTALLGAGEDKEIVTKVVQGASTIYFHGVAILTVLFPDPLV